MTSHKILITEEYKNAHLFLVSLFVYALQVLKALFYDAHFHKLGWKFEQSGLFCATLYKFHKQSFTVTSL